MTFVAEGAGYKNTVGIFTYTENNVPQSAGDIDTIWTVFENFSRLYSGGGLVAGDKVYIGSYPAGTYIGFALIGNGYNGHGNSFKNNNTYYSIPEINPESNSEKLQHNVLLYDETSGRFMIGFEDLYRSGGASDDDFNDALFFCTSNPITAIDTSNVTPIVEELNDCDFDGTPDQGDIAPCDARYASTSTTHGRLMFEDLFPYKGDYDFNDIVVDYEAVAWNSSEGVTGKMEYTFTLKADGGTLTNGFAFSIDGLVSSAVSNVLFGNSASSFEEDDEAVFILANDFSFSGFGYMNNMSNGNTTTEYPTSTVSFEINGASASDVFWGEKLNPMIFQNLDNGKRNEIHLKFKQPSSTAELTLVGQGDDITLLEDVLFEGDWTNATPAERFWAQSLHQGQSTTLPATTNTYTDRNGYPWAMHVDINVKHPYEQVDINDAYPNFSNWVESNGVSSTTWFLSEVSGKVFE
jgi:LruC domain-containing protein